MIHAAVLARVLVSPTEVQGLDEAGWTALLTIGKAEQMIGTLATRLAGLAVPEAAARMLEDARAGAEHARRTALWEAEMARRALGPLGCSVVLLKGTAYAAAGLAAGRGRAIGDLDILVPRGALDEVERALLDAGWEWVKPDAYDDSYYRRWMHELPPLIHRERDRMIDVHHTILPPTARPTPDAAALVTGAVPLGNGLSVLAPADMVVHAAAHLFADGDLAGGMRNLWDVHCLVGEFLGNDPSFHGALMRAAWTHELGDEVGRALRLSHRLFGTTLASAGSPIAIDGRPRPTDALFLHRLLARDGWGRPTRSALRFGFYGRSHWLRMPPHLLARHLWIKWRRGAPA